MCLQASLQREGGGRERNNERRERKREKERNNERRERKRETMKEDREREREREGKKDFPHARVKRRDG